MAREIIRFTNPLPRAVSMAMASSTGGMAMSMSIKRMSTVSSLPPK